MRRLLLGGLIATLAASFAPAHAQELFVVAGAGQDAGASFFAETADGMLFGDMIGFSFNEVAADAGPTSGMQACAAIAFFPNGGNGHHQPPATLDIGCGEVEVTIDPLLQTGSVSGEIPGEVYDLDTGDFLGASTISVDVSFAASGVPIAGAGGGGDVFTLPFIDAGAGLVAGVDASAGGSLGSAELGALSGPADFAFMEEGAGLFAFVSV